MGFFKVFDTKIGNNFGGFTHVVIGSIGVFAIIYLRMIQLLKYNLPVGPDQAVYMYVLKTVENDPRLLLWGGDLAPGNMYYFIYAFPFFPLYFLRWFGLSLENLIIATSLFYGVLYSLLIYLFVKECADDKSLPSIAFLVSSVSISSLIISGMTFRFMIVIISFYIILTLFFKVMKTGRNKYTIPLCIVFLTSATIHPEFTLMTIPVLAGLGLLAFISNREVGKKFFRLMFWIGTITLMFIAITLLLLFATTGRLKIPLIQDALVRIRGYQFMSSANLDPSYLITFYTVGWFSNVVENSIISALAILGVISLVLSKQNIFKSFLLIWTIILTFFIPFFPATVIHRIYYLLPISILSAIGISTILSIIEKVLKRIRITRAVYFAKIISMIALALIAFNLSLVRLEQITPSSKYFWTPSVTHEHLEALNWIKENYRGGNVIILMDRRATGGPHKFFVSWVQYILETRIKNPDPYIGDFSDFLLGKPSLSLPNVAFNSTPAYPNLEDYVVLTLLSDNWELSFYEKNFVIEQLFIHEYGPVYRLVNLTEREKLFWANAWLMLKDLPQLDNFDEMLLPYFYDSFDTFEWRAYALSKDYNLIQDARVEASINESIIKIAVSTDENRTLFNFEKIIRINTTEAPFFQMRFRILDGSNGYYLSFLDRNYSTIKIVPLNEFRDGKWHVISLNLKQIEYIHTIRLVIDSFSSKNAINALEIDYIRIFNIN